MINKLLMFLLGILGFASCSSESEEEYGCPTADFRVMGKVTDDANNLMDSVKVKLICSDGPWDSTMTNAAGFYQLANENGSYRTDFKTVFEKKGYKSDTLNAFISEQDFVGGDGDGYKGLATKIVNAQLKENDK
ncbi:MAG TPA: radical SAM-associated putative lipoprotein [Paludibacteraceae bacterium]|nr:radical SAM-associated putative lipoprotein [Paludibacteraceae bacterium]HPH63960.1 radical SAM-associated putative lipoprotein [Paludibacteraceae bacterium]HQF49817.1 radical SAM-associated putative lipoprotein [Paludibacteraceae bacterium]HQJ91094.1 radical SAM-associated putative lipoprotein [Paludibacteraceae bacterium]